MIKRDIKETIREYDGSGKLVRETITETHEEENDTQTRTLNWWETGPTWNGTDAVRYSNISGPSSECTLSGVCDAADRAVQSNDTATITSVWS